MKPTAAILILTMAGISLSACGGGGGGAGGQNTPPPPAPTFQVTVTSIEVVRTADQLDMIIDGLPVTGATVGVR